MPALKPGGREAGFYPLPGIERLDTLVASAGVHSDGGGLVLHRESDTRTVPARDL
jgi:hypothetical protein